MIEIPQTLRNYVLARRDTLVEETLHFIHTGHVSQKYSTFCLQEPGQKSVREGVDLFLDFLWLQNNQIMTLASTHGLFLAKKNIRYHDDILETCLFLQKKIHELFISACQNYIITTDELVVIMGQFDEHLLSCIRAGSSSFLKASENRVARRMSQLEILYDFTRNVMTSFDIVAFTRTAFEAISTLYEFEAIHLATVNGQQIDNVHTYPLGMGGKKNIEILQKCYDEQVILYVDVKGKTHYKVEDRQLLTCIALPIRAFSQSYGVLCMANYSKYFEYSSREQYYLTHFSSIAGLMIENYLMIREIEAKRSESHQLTEKLLTIQEKERKRIAADIHDSVAQDLTAIGYRLELCKALIKKNPKALNEELNHLIKLVNKSIDVSRELIHSLRPDIVDNLGLVSAVKYLCESFTDETGIDVYFNSCDELPLSAEMKTQVFRIVQEALLNIKKHSHAEFAKVSFKRTNEHLIVQVYDNGIGYQADSGPPQENNQKKFGLLIMKEAIELGGGSFFIRSSSGSGCMIQAKIPLTQHTEP